jgi:acetyl esterase/lipase
MRKANGPEQDYGRQSAKRWVAGQSVAVAKDVAIADPEPHLRIFSPQQICGEPILYLHGGGLVHYDLDAFTPFLSHLSARLGAQVLAVGYEKCPEVPAADIIEALMAKVSDLSHRHGIQRIMGDSIGGLLALYAALRVLPGRLRRAMLLYPVLSLNQTFASYERHGEGHLLDERDMRWFRSLVSPYFLARDFDPLALEPADLADLDVTVASAGCDVLADEARLFAEGRPVRLLSFPDLPHDFCLYHGMVPSAGAALSKIIDVFKLQERNAP